MESWEKEKEVVDFTKEPVTKSRLLGDLRSIGLRAGEAVIVHCSMSQIGWVVGGAMTVIDALMDAVTKDGLIIMPSFTTENGEPSGWNYPSVPEYWWPVIRETMPAYIPELSPTRGLGRIPELFRIFPGVSRSNHPQLSFAAWGNDAEEMLKDHKMDDSFGMSSPLGKLYKFDGKVLLIGVGHLNNSSLHHAEVKANIPNAPWKPRGAAVLVNGIRIWKTWNELDYSDHDFVDLGAAYESSINYRPKLIGQAESRLFSMRNLVDYSVIWMRKNR
ncbi:MAG: aminoglycoside N(3)-acetyltransferase [Candidatus Thorarchaeota archaeon]|nr:aminoglycoside N(3)-acetyltransferase [Candidatus Thorarchaeota archaeon]